MKKNFFFAEIYWNLNPPVDSMHVFKKSFPNICHICMFGLLPFFSNKNVYCNFLLIIVHFRFLLLLSIRKELLGLQIVLRKIKTNLPFGLKRKTSSESRDRSSAAGNRLSGWLDRLEGSDVTGRAGPTVHKPYLTRSVSSCLPRMSDIEVVEETFLLQDMK